MRTIEINASVAYPKQLADRLIEAAQQYRDDAAQLRDMWQDNRAGQVWDDLAAVLERAAGKCERVSTRYFGA